MILRSRVYYLSRNTSPMNTSPTSIKAILIIVVLLFNYGLSLAQEECNDPNLSIFFLEFDCAPDQGQFDLTIQINGDPNQAYNLIGTNIGTPIELMGLETYTLSYSDGTAIAYIIESVSNPNCTAALDYPPFNCTMAAPIDYFSFSCTPNSDSVKFEMTPYYLELADTIFVGDEVLLVSPDDSFFPDTTFCLNLFTGDDFEIEFVGSDGESIFSLSNIVGLDCTDANCNWPQLELLGTCLDLDAGEFELIFLIIGEPDSTYQVSGTGIVTPLDFNGNTEFIAGPYADGTNINLFASNPNFPDCSANEYYSAFPIFSEYGFYEQFTSCYDSACELTINTEIIDLLGTENPTDWTFITEVVIEGVPNATYDITAGFNDSVQFQADSNGNLITTLSFACQINSSNYFHNASYTISVSSSDSNCGDVDILQDPAFDCPASCNYDVELIYPDEPASNADPYSFVALISGSPSSVYLVESNQFGNETIQADVLGFAFFESPPVFCVEDIVLAVTYLESGCPSLEVPVEVNNYCSPETDSECDYEIVDVFASSVEDGFYSVIVTVVGNPGATYNFDTEFFDAQTLSSNSDGILFFESPLIACSTVDTPSSGTIMVSQEGSACPPQMIPFTATDCPCLIEVEYYLNWVEDNMRELIISIVGMPQSSYIVNDDAAYAGQSGVAILNLGTYACHDEVPIYIFSTNYSCAEINTSTMIHCATSVELLRFVGEAIKEGNLLKWSTGTEIDNEYFTIERSPNGINAWEKVKEVDAWGNSSTQIDYSFLDPNAPQGRVFYRLTATDIGGLVTLASEIIQVDRSSQNLEINNYYPVPTTSIVQLSIASNEAMLLQAKVFDTTGKQVHSFTQGLNKGIDVIDLDLSDYANGTYFLSLSTNKETIQIKLLKHYFIISFRTSE